MLRKHYFAQRKLPDAKLNHSGLLQSRGTRAWQPCAWSDQMKLRKRLAISQIVSTLMHTLFIDYDHFSTPNFKRKKSINPSIFHLGKYASIIILWRTKLIWKWLVNLCFVCLLLNYEARYFRSKFKIRYFRKFLYISGNISVLTMLIRKYAHKINRSVILAICFLTLKN